MMMKEGYITVVAANEMKRYRLYAATRDEKKFIRMKILLAKSSGEPGHRMDAAEGSGSRGSLNKPDQPNLLKKDVEAHRTTCGCP